MATVLLAGATGAVGTVLLPQLRAAGFTVLPHVRPKTAERHPLGKDGDALVFELSDGAALDAAMERADAVACLVGTMKRRFAAGDTYESSDYLPVAQLVDSARRVPSREPRQILLLSALGVRKSGNAYLAAKWRAEEKVRESGLPWTIVRPSFLDSSGTGAAPSDGRARKPPPLVGGALQALGALPGLRGVSDDLRPIPIDVLSRALVRILRDRGPTQAVLTGRALWKLA